MTLNEIKSMTSMEKIQIMEQIWETLVEEDVPESPQWHKELLEARRAKVKNSSAKFLTLDELKKLNSI